MKIKTNSKGAIQYLKRLKIFLILYTILAFTHNKVTNYLYFYDLTVTDKWPMVLFFAVIVFFSYLRWDKIEKLPTYKNSLPQTIIFSLIGLAVFYMPVDYFTSTLQMSYITSYFLPFYAGILLFFLAIFNIRFARFFTSEVTVLLLIVASYLMIAVTVSSHWQFFSKIIIFALSYTMPLISDQVYVNPETYNVAVENFSVFIGPPCAGIYSLVTFALLFFLALNLVQKSRKIDKFKATLAFISGLLAVFLLNIVRVGLIIVIGAYYSPEIAINLFHEYLSAIFLVAIFAVYLYDVLPYIVKR